MEETIQIGKRGCAPAFDALSAKDQSEDINFYKNLFALALPVALQSLISAAVSAADVLMLTTVSENALSAVSLASRVTFILTLLFMGLTTGVMILSAQYWGKNDEKTIRRVLGFALGLSIFISCVFATAALLFPAALMRLFSPDAALLPFGIRYLRLISLSYLFMGGSQMLLATLKSVEKTRAASIISAVCMAVNVALNALSVFVLFPNDPLRAVTGVAAATVCARFVELLLCLLWHDRETGSGMLLHPSFDAAGWLKKDFVKCALPVTLNYIVWGGALTVTSGIIGHLSTSMVAANSAASAIRELITVGCTGLAVGGSVLLGKHLGAGRKALALRDGMRLKRCALAIGAASGLLMLLIRPVCLAAIPLSPESKALLDGMLLLCALNCVGKAYNSTLVSGIFCAGGDTRFGLICDIIAMWGVILPIGYLCAFVWNAPLLVVYLVFCVDEYVKMPFVAAHYSRCGWLKQLTK